MKTERELLATMAATILAGMLANSLVDEKYRDIQTDNAIDYAKRIIEKIN